MKLALALCHDLRHRLLSQVERVRGLIPLGYESNSPLGQFLLAEEIHDSRSLPSGDAESLLHLVHPRTMQDTGHALSTRGKCGTWNANMIS
jgi:hypothetical protein